MRSTRNKTLTILFSFSLLSLLESTLHATLISLNFFLDRSFFKEAFLFSLACHFSAYFSFWGGTLFCKSKTLLHPNLDRFAELLFGSFKSNSSSSERSLTVIKSFDFTKSINLAVKFKISGMCCCSRGHDVAIAYSSISAHHCLVALQRSIVEVLSSADIFTCC